MSEALQIEQENSLALGSRIARLARRREFGVLFLLLLTIVGVSVINPAFLAAENIRDILVKNVPVAIAGCALTLVIVTGEIDISVGSLMGVLATVAGLLASPSHWGLPVPLAVLLTLLVGAAVGFVNGFLVAVSRVPSIIVTLGMLTALRGINEILMRGEWITDLPPGLRFLGVGEVLGVRVSLWAAAVVIVACIVFARQTALGRCVYAVGSNPAAARLAGISEKRIKLLVFTLTGFLTAVATLVSVPQLSVIDSGIGVGFELLVVTCVVVGGTSISGGRGTIVGTLLGVLLLGTVGTALIFMKLGQRATYWERAIQGGFILLAVLVDHVTTRRSAGEGGQ